jgi:hypothetical protein
LEVPHAGCQAGPKISRERIVAAMATNGRSKRA